MINIAKLLKDAPKGMKLYSPLFGEVEFLYVNSCDNTILVATDMHTNYCFTANGIFPMFKCHPNAECLLFPSKECRTWENFELPVQHKFKVGDWLVYKYGNCFAGGFRKSQVVKVKDGVYYFSTGTTGSCKFIEESCRLWSIADAKDGDVLATNNIVCIFNKLDKDGYYIISPCIYTVKDGFEVIDDEDDSIGSCGFSPATKEDRELLFRKMKEAGYEWDDEKKELKKIQPHYDIKNFHAGMPVLVRADNNCRWDYSVFSRITGNVDWNFAVCNGVSVAQCIPFSDDTKHLLGTNDPCGEEFINW